MQKRGKNVKSNLHINIVNKRQNLLGSKRAHSLSRKLILNLSARVTIVLRVALDSMIFACFIAENIY